jgi:hypothetical protein
MSVFSPLMDRAKRGSKTDTLFRIQALRVLNIKEAIVNQVGAGQLSLLTAAARFQAVNRQAGHPVYPQGLPSGPQDGEALCRNLIGWVQLALRDRPEQAEAVCQRLELELQDHLNRFGRVDLPSAD